MDSGVYALWCRIQNILKICTFMTGALHITIALAQILQACTLLYTIHPFIFSSKAKTHQKCTVLIPIGLSHSLFAQLCGPAGAAVLCHLLPWNLLLVDLNACDCA